MRKLCTMLALALAAAGLGCDPSPNGTGATTDGPASTSEADTAAATSTGQDATWGATLTSAADSSTGASTGGEDTSDDTSGGDTSTSGPDASTGGVGGDTSTGEDSGEDPPLVCEGAPCVTSEDCSPRGDGLLYCAPVAVPICVAVCDDADPHACDDQPERCSTIGGLGLCLPPVNKQPVNGECVAL